MMVGSRGYRDRGGLEVGTVSTAGEVDETALVHFQVEFVSSAHHCKQATKSACRAAMLSSG